MGGPGDSATSSFGYGTEEYLIFFVLLWVLSKKKNNHHPPKKKHEVGTRKNYAEEEKGNREAEEFLWIKILTKKNRKKNRQPSAVGSARLSRFPFQKRKQKNADIFSFMNKKKKREKCSDFCWFIFKTESLIGDFLHLFLLFFCRHSFFIIKNNKPRLNSWDFYLDEEILFHPTKNGFQVGAAKLDQVWLFTRFTRRFTWIKTIYDEWNVELHQYHRAG